MNVDALEGTLEALELGDEHEAIVEACRGLAAACDANPSSAALWREYRETLELVMLAGEKVEDDGHARLLELVRPPVRDEKTAGT